MNKNDIIYLIHKIHSYMIEKIHLKIIQALAENGTLTAAAHALCLTQPALSHQIRYLEKKLGLALWQREGRQLRLTRAGEYLLSAANQVLPVFEQSENMLKAYADGKQGLLRIGVECHPCYTWLKGVLNSFLQDLPDVDIDIINQFQFSGLEGLMNYHVDVLVTPDPVPQQKIHYHPLFDYELVLLVANTHPLATQTHITAQELEPEMLLTFPIAHERLDIFTRFLWPAGITPQTKAIASMDIMVQMVSLNRGITVLPDWLADNYRRQLPVSILRPSTGITKTLFAATRQQDVAIPYIHRFVELARAHDNRASSSNT